MRDTERVRWYDDFRRERRQDKLHESQHCYEGDDTRGVRREKPPNGSPDEHAQGQQQQREGDWGHARDEHLRRLYESSTRRDGGDDMSCPPLHDQREE
jgi:hypothetical protein